MAAPNDGRQMAVAGGSSVLHTDTCNPKPLSGVRRIGTYSPHEIDPTTSVALLFYSFLKKHAYTNAPVLPRKADVSMKSGDFQCD